MVLLFVVAPDPLPRDLNRPCTWTYEDEDEDEHEDVHGTSTSTNPRAR